MAKFKIGDKLKPVNPMLYVSDDNWDNIVERGFVVENVTNVENCVIFEGADRAFPESWFEKEVKKMGKFEVGDKVVCVEKDNYLQRIIKPGEILTVKRIGGYNKDLFESEEFGGLFFTNRFEKAKSEKTFNKGDKVALKAEHQTTEVKYQYAFSGGNVYTVIDSIYFEALGDIIEVINDVGERWNMDGNRFEKVEVMFKKGDKLITKVNVTKKMIDDNFSLQNDWRIVNEKGFIVDRLYPNRVRFVGSTFNYPIDWFEKLEPWIVNKDYTHLHGEKIMVFTRNKQVMVAYDCVVGVAKCNPDDTYDLDFGIELAFVRATINLWKAKEQELMHQC